MKRHLPTFPLLDRNDQLLMLATLNRSQIGRMFSQLLEVSIDPPETNVASISDASDHLLM